MGPETHPPHMDRPHSHLLTDGRRRKREVETSGLVRARGGTDNDCGLVRTEGRRPWTDCWLTEGRQLVVVAVVVVWTKREAIHLLN